LRNVDAEALFQSLYHGLAQEHDDLIASTLCSFLGTLMTRLDGSKRDLAEQQLYDMAYSHSVQSVRQTLLRQLSLKATSPDAINKLYDIWKSESASFLNNRDYTKMAYHLAIMRPDIWNDILATQRERLKNMDELNEFDFVSRACNPDSLVQQRLFNELLEVENRRVEPWVRTMLALLNNPVREPWSNRYLVAGLDELEEIQRTGDIFFPGYWLSSLLEGHCSLEACEMVNKWIDSHPMLAPALKNKLLENAYWLLEMQDVK
jgi:aminopeptidase N